MVFPLRRVEIARAPLQPQQANVTRVSTTLCSNPPTAPRPAAMNLGEIRPPTSNGLRIPASVCPPIREQTDLVGQPCAYFNGHRYEAAVVIACGDGNRYALRLADRTVWTTRDRLDLRARRAETPGVDISLSPLSTTRERNYFRQRRIFPNVDRGNWRVEAPPTPSYNCIAHSVHDETHWVWPGPSVQAFDAFYHSRGYLQLGSHPLTDVAYALQANIERVILYALPGPPVVCTHAIYQEPDGSWSSKNGTLAQVRVESPQQLSNEIYGVPYRSYFRLRSPNPEACT